MSSVIFTAEGPMLNALLLQHSTLFTGKEEVVWVVWAREWGWGPDISKYHITNIKTVIKPCSASHNLTKQAELRWHQRSNRNSDWCRWMSNERCHGGILAELNTKFVPLVINYDGGARTVHGRGKWLHCHDKEINESFVYIILFVAAATCMC